jgi:hypothetical protein
MMPLFRAMYEPELRRARLACAAVLLLAICLAGAAAETG